MGAAGNKDGEEKEKRDERCIMFFGIHEHTPREFLSIFMRGKSIAYQIFCFFEKHIESIEVFWHPILLF